jgi:hypothetical protein
MDQGRRNTFVAALLLLAATSCATSRGVYRDPEMDFGAVRRVAVMPLENLSREAQGAERVREVFSSMLIASGSIYVVPPGEVARGIVTVGVVTPATPTSDNIVALGKQLKVDAIFTGTLKEYGEMRAGNAAANVISVSMQLSDAGTGKIVWSGSTTKGGVGFLTRLFGGGASPMNDVTEEAINELINKLFG